MINMKKILKNGKKAVAGLVLTMMAVCMISSVAQASYTVDVTAKRKTNSIGYYYSYTYVSAHQSSNGMPINVKAGARMDGYEWTYRSGAGSVTAKSEAISSKKNALHCYWIAGDKTGEYIGN